MPREPDVFAHGHLPDSFNVPLSGRYATYSGMVLDRRAPIVIVADPGREREAIVRLGRIGFDHVAGYLPELPREPRISSAGMSASTLAIELLGADKPVVLDVRMPGEYAGGHIDGAVNIPLHRLRERLADVPRARRVAVVCRTGHRSSVAVRAIRTCHPPAGP